MNEFLDLIYNEPEKIVAAYFKDREGNPMQLAPYQTDIIKKLIKRDCDRFIVVAATQSGKSSTLSVLLSLFALFYPNEQIVNVSATEEQARIIFERVKAHLVEDNPMIRQLVDMNRSLGASKEFSKRRMFMKNGTEIRILATGKGETENVGTSLLGFAASILTVDEAALIPSDVFTTKVLRMLGAKRKSGLKKILILSSTPQTANWFEDAWNDPEYQRYKVDWKMAVEAGRMDIKTVMEQKRKMTRSQFCSWYEAEFPSMTEDSVFDMEEVNRNTIPQDTKFYGEKILSVDIARFGADFTIFLMLDKTDNGFRVVEILSDEKKDLMHTVGRIIDLNKKHCFDKIVVDEAGLGCLTEGTEVLTTNGWIPIEKIKPNERIYSKTEDMVTIEKIYSIEEKEAETICLDNGYSFSSGHFLPLRTRKEYPFRLYSWDSATKFKYFSLDTTFNWYCSKSNFELKGTKLRMPYGGIKETGVKSKIDGLNFAKLLGWFLSEGNLDECAINITQSEKSKHLKNIEESILSCGLKFTKKISKAREIRYIIYSKELRDWIEKNCYHSKPRHSQNKKIPLWLKNNSKEVIASFLEQYNKGDGTIHHGSREYFSNSKEMAEGVLELVYKSGKYGNIRIKQPKGSETFIHGRKLVRENDCFVVYEWKDKVISVSPKIIKKEQSKVYDLSISGKSKLFMIRFKDKRAFWVHNGGVKDRLKEQSIPVIGVIAGSKCTTETMSDVCLNLKAELYMKAKKLFETDKLKIIDKGQLKNELRKMKKEFQSTGKIKIIDPEEKSPDYASALVYGLHEASKGSFVMVGLGSSERGITGFGGK
jgi:hypothetical protein